MQEALIEVPTMRRLADIERISDRCAMAPLSAWRIALGGFFPRRSGAGSAVERD